MVARGKDCLETGAKWVRRMSREREGSRVRLASMVSTVIPASEV